jgi:glycosyltransferase involved in cell wall biosynthesis
VGTGIDRVERAYLDHLLAAGDARTRFLVRSTRGVLFFGADGARALRHCLDDPAALPRADLMSRLAGRGGRPRHRAEALLRRHAIDRAPAWGIGRLIARHAGPGVIFLTVGHSNLTGRLLGPLRKAGVRVVAMVHDLIPLTHPDTVPPDMPARFATRIETLRCHADMVLCNSARTAEELGRHWQDATRQPDRVVVPLGLDPVGRPDVEKDPAAFVMLGTIEPRKNHVLMLEVWEALAADPGLPRMPVLHLIGPRGWHDRAFFDRLAAHPLYGRQIIEHGPLPEPEMRARLAAAGALLFPSLAEGYGYPPLEAQMLGTLPVVADIPTLHEVLGPHAVYLPPDRAYPWVETIKKCLSGTLRLPEPRADPPPSWEDHFHAVHRAIRDDRTKDSP